jgi:hypothetical protein
MQKIQLLSHNAYHPRQGGPDGIGSWDASFLVELIGQPPTDAMGLALHPRDAMTHRKEERPIRQIPRQQPESVIAGVSCARGTIATGRRWAGFRTDPIGARNSDWSPPSASRRFQAA